MGILRIPAHPQSHSLDGSSATGPSTTKPLPLLSRDRFFEETHSTHREMSAPTVPYVLPDTQNQAWSSDTSRFGHKMLSKFGWTSGKGLGKKEDGMTGHVRVSKRLESLGLGARTASSGGEVALSSTMSDYDNLLASLRPTKRARSESEEEDSSSSEEEDEESEGEGEGEGKGEGKGKGKKAKAPAAPVRFIGRFAHHRNLRQKNVAGYSEADLAAILGTHTLGSGGSVGGAGESVALPSAPQVQRASLTLSVRKKKKEGEGKKAKKSKEEKQEKRERKEKKRAKKEAKREKRGAEEKEEGGKKKKSQKQ